MPSLSEMFPSSFIKATVSGTLNLDIAEDADRAVLTIKEVGKIVEFQDGRKSLELHFNETDMTFAANHTNRQAIAKLAKSDQTEDWAGLKIELFVVPEPMSKDTGHAIRIREPRVAKAPKAPPRVTPEGPQPTPVPGVLGVEGLNRLAKALDKVGKKAPALKAYLIHTAKVCREGDETLGKSPSEWPQAWAPAIKAFLEAAENEAKATVTEEDIPF